MEVKSLLIIFCDLNEKMNALILSLVYRLII